VDRSPSFPFDVDPHRTPSAADAVHLAAFRGAVDGADAYRGTREAVRVDGDTLRLGNRFVRLPRYREVAFVALGNAAPSLAYAVSDALGERLTQGFVAGPDPAPEEVPFRSARIPRGAPGSKEGEEAARTVLELAAGLREGDLLLLLLSPGALGALAVAPSGMTGAELAGLVQSLVRAGASPRETSLVAAAIGDGAVDGRLAASVRGAELVTVVVDRGDGGALVGGGPSWRLGDAEREEARHAIERLALASALPEVARQRLGSPAVPSVPRPPSVFRPVVVSEPADALRGAADAVAEKRYIPRLAQLSYAEGPAAAAEAFAARIEEVLAAEPGLLRMTERDGVAIFGGATLGLPEGYDARAGARAFLRAAGPLVRRRGTSLGAFATAGGGDRLDPPGLVLDASTAGAPTPPFRGFGMRSGITDVGIVLAAVVPSRPS
jgi:glycerate-2-kinase